MTEHAILILLGFASIAATFAGFSGVVVVFGGRALGNWTPGERFRTTNMLILSLGVCLFSFVPLTAELFQLSNQGIWITSSLILGIFSTYYFIYAAVTISNLGLVRSRALVEWVRYVFFSCLLVATVLQVLNVSGLMIRGPGPFITGLMLLLIPAALQFAMLILVPLGISGNQQP